MGASSVVGHMLLSLRLFVLNDTSADRNKVPAVKRVACV